MWRTYKKGHHLKCTCMTCYVYLVIFVCNLCLFSNLRLHCCKSSFLCLLLFCVQNLCELNNSEL